MIEKCAKCKAPINLETDVYGITEMVIVWGRDMDPRDVNTGRQKLCDKCAGKHLKWITNGMEELLTVSIVQEN